MDKLTGCFLSVLLLAVLNFVSAEDAFFGEGGVLLLRPPKISGEITSIQWKHNNNLVAECVIVAVPLVYYGGFIGRTTLNTTTGYLEIRKMTLADSGEYSVEINNRVQTERYNAKLIKAVPKPTVLVKPLICSTASENCTLTCDGNTEEAEPVTYSWKMRGGEWIDGKKDRSITNDETIQSVKMFSCRMKNPISEEVSDPIPNPFIREEHPSNTGKIVGVILFLLLLAGVIVGLGVWKQKYIKKRFFPQSPDNSNNENGTRDEMKSMNASSTDGNNGTSAPENQ